ncbi:hypothetical protein [Planomonospora parontospora]|uniref:hypothetical protein n=1 Tax=Planomonospora parontospora TaxID=58119 RepID=UPI00167163CF|nr:hypothetical protein [Planomonospora parontospora]GGL34959.1 hypothetical protein GCM10014719_40230 [Planomonospora parontospora subsp. antibiotica]GII17239.1 hypothetical protein Ppa05_39650 [Planomonospora parontospora subsp. antibiotica]
MADQWELLRGAGLSRGFTGTWVGSGDAEAVAALLGADPASRQDCDLATAMACYRPMAFTERIWTGPHADGWTHALTISGPPPVTTGLTEAGLRFLQIRTMDSYVYDLLYGDGVTTAWLTQRWYGEVVVEPGSMVEPYLREIDRPMMPEAVHSGSGTTEPEDHNLVCLEIYLLLTARMSGRFVDRAWLGEKRALYTVPVPPPT